MRKQQLRQFPHLRQRKTVRDPTKSKPSAFESEILPLHKPGVYDKGFRPPEALRGLAKREGVMTWRGILL
jgi:hypothetical protein